MSVLDEKPKKLYHALVPNMNVQRMHEFHGKVWLIRGGELDFSEDEDGDGYWDLEPDPAKERLEISLAINKIPIFLTTSIRTFHSATLPLPSCAFPDVHRA